MFVRTQAGLFINASEIATLRPNSPVHPSEYKVREKSGDEHVVAAFEAEKLFDLPTTMCPAQPGYFVASVVWLGFEIDVGLDPVIAWGLNSMGFTVAITRLGANGGLHEDADIVTPDGQVHAANGERWSTLFHYTDEKRQNFRIEKLKAEERADR